MAEPASINAASASLIFLGAAVVSVPLFRFFGLSAVLGYLLAGLVIGPSGLGLFSEAETLRSIAELGIVMFLFIIGLELKPSKLLSMRGDIGGLGVTQLIFTGILLALLLKIMGYNGIGLIAIAFAFALSATAIALQLLEERGALATPYGQKTFAVLLFQDMAIVPFIAILPLMGDAASGDGMGGMRENITQLSIAFGALGALLLAGKFLLNPLFRLLAKTDAREVMTAAALLVVLGSAEAMHHVGLSAALGAFIAGLMLSESNFRHQLEADIEPFRGLLLGLFFISVGMGMDGKVIADNPTFILAASFFVMVLKSLIVFLLMRLAKLNRPDSARAAFLLSPAGEFTFVILPLAAQLGLINGKTASLMGAIAAFTMFLGPLAYKGLEALLSRQAERNAAKGAEREEDFSDASGDVLVIGFGRFGQVVNQMFLAASSDVTVIDRNIDQIKTAARFGFKVYYGDGRRLDVLRAAGAEKAAIIAICVDDKEGASMIAEMVQRSFPRARVFARAYDRTHALDLMERGIKFPYRETFESALIFGREALVGLGVSADEAEDIRQDVRRRDIARLLKQRDEGLLAGLDLLHGAGITPEPLSTPRRKGRDLLANAPTQPPVNPGEGMSGESS